MPLCSSFTRSPLWDKAVWEALVEIGNPGETIFAIVAAKRISDKASYGLFCTDQALYLLRSEFACERVPWENVGVFAPNDYVNYAVQFVLSKTTHSTKPASGEVDSIRHLFQISQNNNQDIKRFIDFAMMKMSEFKIYKERIEVLPGIKPEFNWRVFAGTIQLVQFTDINIENPSEEEKAQMNSALRSRINELAPKFAELEQSFPFNEDGWRTRGEPEKEIDPGQLVVGANLQNADLSGEDISFKYLMNVDFENADLSNCNLQFAFLLGANLKNANLADSDLSGAILQGCNLEGANLSNCNLTWSTINYANLKDADLSGSDLRCALLSDAVLVNANMARSKMGYLALDRQIRKGRKKTNYALASADSLKGTFLVGADLSSANLFGADLDASNCYFKDPSGRSAAFNGTVMPEGYKFD
jgi:uncharacterized protein YjbI with pentapeptide repeats